MPEVVPYRHRGRVSGSPGAPTSLYSGELAYNHVDGVWYCGYGDNGSGVATSIKAVARDNFAGHNIPAGGADGKILAWSAGAPVWADAPEGALYTAGSGLSLNGTAFSIDDAIVVTHSDLTGALTAYATTSALTSGLAGKANSTHTHSASDIVSGTIDPARLPASVFQAAIVAASNIASLTAPQQADIRAGSTVVTSDGRSWMYSGSGSKTAEASYREMADTTPEWTTIANKPSFGTMSAQNASSVAITGGTISGVTLSGMVITGGVF